MIGRLAAFDELLVTLAMVVSAFVGAAVVTAFSLYAAPMAGVALSLVGLGVSRALVLRTARSRADFPGARIRT